jgi:hypothetical protein
MKRFSIILVLFAFLMGCAGMREGVVRVSEEDIINAQISREVALNLLQTWPINSGFIRGALGDRITEMPEQALNAMDRLDELAIEYLAGEHEIDDWEAGESLGLRIRLMAATVREALMMFAPEVLQMLPVGLILS